MNQQITFGKFRGWTPLELARAGEAGRGYLSWGSEHLKSPKWARAFEAALQANVQAEAKLTARAIMKGDDDISYAEALSLAKEEIEQEEEDEAFLSALENRQNAVVKRWAKIMRVPPEKLRGLARRYEWSECQPSASQFSSTTMHHDFKAFMSAWIASYDEE